ncbi:cytosol aminopeptidase [Acrasis kona]|uniref:Cytosol aminopeptidase n=1 Tax=Acrasis kona TaxID=1008807 RepID=A0AAW2YLJ5_9EUKA
MSPQKDSRVPTKKNLRMMELTPSNNGTADKKTKCPLMLIVVLDAAAEQGILQSSKITKREPVGLLLPFVNCAEKVVEVGKILIHNLQITRDAPNGDQNLI